MNTQKQNNETSDAPASIGLIVLGMHRSGTSALAGALGLCGAWLGEENELTAANFENPKGFWERRDVRTICDRLLHASGADWWKVGAFEQNGIPHISSLEEGRAFQRVVAELDFHGVWALKEPRLCLLFGMLRSLLTKCVCIHIQRNPLDVAQSLRARNGFGIAEGLALWEAYNRAALQASTGLPRLIVSYEALVSEPEKTLTTVLAELSSFGVSGLALPAMRSLEEFITPSLRHQKTTVSEAADFLLPSQAKLWSQLRSGEALRSDAPAELSVVAHQYLRDLESRKGSIDQLLKKVKNSDIETKKTVSAIQAEQAKVRTLEAQLAKRTAEANKMSSRIEAQEARVEDLKSRLEERANEYREIAATVDKLKDAASYRTSELRKLAAQASASEERIGTLESQLSAVYSSRSWRLTAPVRAVSQLAKWVFRFLRNVARLIFWLATGRLGRISEALLPRYRRYLPARVRAAVPSKLRRVVTSRVAANKRPPLPHTPGSAGSEQDAAGSSSNGHKHTHVSSETDASRFGQELRRILDEATVSGPAGGLHQSEHQLSQTRLRIQRLPDRPLVSVIMPTHNRAATIGGSIATVLEQTYSNWELLVCDDESIDDTEAVIAKFFDNRIRYFNLPKQGAAAARNVGLKNARGTIIAYLDSDNFWHPAFLTAVVLALLENPGRSAVYTDFIDFHVDKYGKRKRASFKRSSFDHQRLLQRPYIDLNSFAHRRELFDCFGGFDERLKRRQDYDLILKYTWLRDPLHVSCFTTLYQRNESLAQITRLQREDRSCVSIIDASLEEYLENGLPLPERRPVEKVTVISWDLCRNHFSKPFALAEALSTQYDVQLISFRFFDEDIFPPLKDVDAPFETLYLPGGKFPEFFESMHQALAAIRGDVIYVVKPRLPSLGLALLANFQRATPIILEINDLETVVTSPGKSGEHLEAEFGSVDLDNRELLTPYSDLWSQLMHSVAREIPVLTTHNQAIDRDFDNRCLYMRNVKNELVYNPAAYHREAIRTDLGFAPEDRVILFGGMIRKHKGIHELVELIDRLDDPRYKLLFVGSRTTPDQIKLINRHGDRVRVLPPQNREAMAQINYAADLVVLWLDPRVPASHYQMPYKATDAFAMGPAVIANDISDLGLLGRQGYLKRVPFGDWQTLIKVVRDIFENPDETAARRDATRKLFLRQFSYAAARANFQLAASRATARTPAVLPVADSFARRFGEFYRQVARSERDFISLHGQTNGQNVPGETKLPGYGDSEFDGSIVVSDARDIDQMFHEDTAGVAVIMPSVDISKGLETARALVGRAGMEATVFVVEDTLRQGFVRTLNAATQRLNVAYLVYVAEDAFPGVDWLRIAYEALERTGKGLLAFNDGKWGGRIAGFGMVRTSWARKIYGGPILFPGYKAHKADNELTLIARIMKDFVYEPTATLVELDASKALTGGEDLDGHQKAPDRNLFYERFHSTFDGRFQWRHVAPYKDEYLNLRKLRAESGESHEPTNELIRHVDVANIRSLSWCDPEGIAIVMPCVHLTTALATAQLLTRRAGVTARIYIVEDSQRRGFIATLNEAAAQLDVKYIVYLAEDAFPGKNWLRIAHERMEESGKGLLAFNCGKWHGRVAAFGMVRKEWVQQMYGSGIILHPTYKAHKADNELTIIARVRQQFIYEPDSVLIENDPKKVFKENIPEDKATFHRRFLAGFGGLAAFEHLKPLAESYFVPLEKPSCNNEKVPANTEIRAEEGDSPSKTPNAGRNLSYLPPQPRRLSDTDRPPELELSGALRDSMTNLRLPILEAEKGQTSDPALFGILDELKVLAEEALQRRPYSVVDKSTIPPSGNPQDYWHPAPYWWPDPGTPDGLPYVRRDGQRAPGTRMYDPESDKYDRTRLQRVFDDSLIFGLAWFFFNDTRYAEAGARIVERFFVDPSTRMNPHLNYAQVRMGHNANQGSPTGLIEAKDMYFYLDAVRLFKLANVLSEPVSQSFNAWLRTYLDWLLSSAQGKAEATASNNHGTCYDLQIGSIASFLGDTEIVCQTLGRAQARITGQFGPDGRQPEELKRETTAHYCCFNFQSWINLAELSSRWGVDLWEYEAPNGAGLKKAAKWLLSHINRPWPYDQIDTFDGDRLVPIWFAASERLDSLSSIEPGVRSVYDVKPVFFPHDGIRPFWNLASYAAAVDSPNQRSQSQPEQSLGRT